VGSLVERILAVPGALVYVLVGLIVFAEDALFVGFVIPGETAAVLGGVDASRGHVDLWLMILLVVVAAIVGDIVGYAIGWRVGPRSCGPGFSAGIVGGSGRPKSSWAAAAGPPSSSAGSSRSSAPSCRLSRAA
jgi:hypothetical protein